MGCRSTGLHRAADVVSSGLSLRGSLEFPTCVSNHYQLPTDVKAKLLVRPWSVSMAPPTCKVVQALSSTGRGGARFRKMYDWCGAADIAEFVGSVAMLMYIAPWCAD